jgi:uncharacterized protein (DUF849 family)
MLIEAAISGSRTLAEHPAIPVTPAQRAVEASAAVLEGAGAIHVHVRDGGGLESLAPKDVAATLEAVRAAAWETVELAAKRRDDTRTGFEDVLTLPDGSRAESNAALVAAARRIADWDPSPSTAPTPAPPRKEEGIFRKRQARRRRCAA